MSPRVTVVLLTYNHEAFIAEAIDSVLMQETEFPFEIVVVEDCSTDRTRDILADYQARFPNVIRLELAPTNQNDNKAWGRAILNARGDYVALLDGDDYWTSPHKLQKQVDFIAQHPECSMCFHNAQIIYSDGSHASREYNALNQQEISTIDDLWNRNFIATSSVLFRSRLLICLPEWYDSMRFGDWPLHILYAERGTIGYLPETMAVYRRHGGGVFGGMSESQQIEAVIKFYEEIAPYAEAHHRTIKAAKVKHHYLLSMAYLAEVDVRSARRSFMTALLSRPFAVHLRANRHECVRLFWPVFFPRTSKLLRTLRASIRKLRPAHSCGRS